jgi:predicted RNA-binding protein with PUA-like domain
MKKQSQHWLVKSEPEAYAWATFVRERRTAWTGVRNYQARNHLNAMRPGDPVLFYESVGPKAVAGLAEVTHTAFPDTTTTEPGWVAVELKAVRALAHPVRLAAIKADPALSEIALIRQSRLSVLPLTASEFKRILELGS